MSLVRLPAGYKYKEFSSSPPPPPPPPPPPEGTGTVFSRQLAGSGGGGIGHTVRQALSAGALSAPPGVPTKIRLTIKAAQGEGLALAGMHIGHLTGQYSFAAQPMPVLFSGSPNVQIPAGATAVTDWALFSWDKSSNLLLSFYLGAQDDSAARDTAFAQAQYYYKAGDDAATANASGYISAGNIWDGVISIEMDGF